MAFVIAELKETIYMEIPEGVELSEELKKLKAEGKVIACLLDRSLHGLKQSARVWQERMSSYLIRIGFKRTNGDYSAFINLFNGVIIVVHLDDMLITGPEAAIISTKMQLKAEFLMKDLDEVETALGIQFKLTQTESTIGGTTKIHQKRYIEEKLRELGLDQCRPVATPGDGLIPSFEDGIDEAANPTEYESLVGSLMYASCCTRPDITAMVNRLTQFFNKPFTRHMAAAKRVWKYLKGTADLGLVFTSNGSNGTLKAYSDADYGTNTKDQRSVGANIFLLANAPIVWQSKRQRIMATSTLEAEYMALGAAIREAL